MKPNFEERRLSTILVSDVVGYSKLMAVDEQGTFAQLKAIEKELIEPKTEQYHGRVVKLTGDGALMEFASVVDAALFALDVQHALEDRNAEIPEDRRIRFRIGINIGDVIVSQDDIYGDGVNIAARLQQIAEPGTVFVSRYVFNHAKGKADLQFECLGKKHVKNIPEPVEVYKVTPAVSGRHPSTHRPATTSNLMRQVMLIVGPLLLIVGGSLAWLRPWDAAIDTAVVARMAYPLPERPSIAVLPFANVSGDAEQEYFADGMTDDLITDLSQVSGLFVIARNSVFTYKGKPIRVQQVAEELGVRYVLEGSVRRAQGRIRINAQLTDATTGRHLWAERYDRDYKDIFALQDEVTKRIVSALYVQLTDVEKAQLASGKTDDLEAYEYYLRGQKAVHGFSISYTEELNTALVMFEEAIKRDPTFARAYIGHALVNHYVWRVAYVVPTRSVIDARSEARKSILAALALDPGIPEAYSVLAQILLAESRYDEAIAAAENAIKLDPNNADSYVVQALVQTKAGRHEEAVETMARAFRLNPKPPPHYDLYLGKVRFDNRDYENAIKSLEKGLRGQPRASLFLWYLAPAYAYSGRLKQAKAEILGILGFVAHENLMRLERIGLYKLESDRAHFVEGFRLAGIKDLPFGYGAKMATKLAGGEIKALLFGRTVRAVNTRNFQRFLLDRTSEGKLTIRGPLGTDTGISKVEDDQICDRLQSLGHRRSCGYLYRETESTPSGQDSHLLVMDEGIFRIATVTPTADH